MDGLSGLGEGRDSTSCSAEGVEFVRPPRRILGESGRGAAALLFFLIHLCSLPPVKTIFPDEIFEELVMEELFLLLFIPLLL